MRAIIIIISFGLLFSCQNELQSSDEFVNQFINYLKNDNSQGLYKNCYVSSKSDIKKMMQEVSKSKKIDKKQLNYLYKATKEDKHNLCSKTNLIINSNSSIRIDSIVDSPQKIKGFGGDIEPNVGVRMNNISAYIRIDNISYKVIFRCIDLKTGMWRTASHPKVVKMNK